MLACAAAAVSAMAAVSCDGMALGTRLGGGPAGRIIDHRSANVEGITAARVVGAKSELAAAYWHTSHGSQLVTGVDGMDHFYGDRGWYLLNGAKGLSLAEPGGDIGSFDGADLDRSIELFQQAVRDYLDDPAHASTNVVMASWCGQVSGASESNIANYLARMSALESEYPSVTFVYMTGHSDGSGPAGNLHLRDQQIRSYCATNGKWLYDFYDIECYDPDGTYFGDKRVSDACNYDFDNDGTTEGDESGPSGGDRNWAQAWQNSHDEGAGHDWWSCGAAHSQPLNGNQKAKAAWQLWCAIADER
jgi:hypothetical protein